MLKKLGLLLITLGLLSILFPVYFFNKGQKPEFIISVLLSTTTTFIGISVLAIHLNIGKIQKLKTIFLLISLVFLAFGLLSKYKYWPGAGIEIILGVFSYCFIYAPVELYLKNSKWREFSNNTWEMFLLSSLDFVGVNLILIGILSKIMHWPGQNYLIYPGCALLLLGLFSWNLRFKQEVVKRKKSEDLIKLQYQQIEHEKQISENLLLNILPSEVAEELKAKGSADAKQFDEVTVLFTDFKDFTKLSEKMSASELVEEIHTCFKAFDNIMERRGIEKIKTIGDSYMCAGGLPVSNSTHAVDVVSAGLDIQKYIQQRVNERIAAGKDPFQIRIGIHTGPVVAGIVGVKKFAYDIWGDTVNTASRMESSGEAGKVNISEATYELVKDKFNCIPRGKILAKGKGEMEMYFVEN